MSEFKNWTASLRQAELICVLVKPYLVSGEFHWVDVMDGSVIQSHYSFKLVTLFSICAFPMITLSTKLPSLLQKLCRLYLSTKSARLAEQDQLAAGDLQGICMSIKLRRNELTMSNKAKPWANTFSKPFLLSSFYCFLSLRHNQC